MTGTVVHGNHGVRTHHVICPHLFVGRNKRHMDVFFYRPTSVRWVKEKTRGSHLRQRTLSDVIWGWSVRVKLSHTHPMGSVPFGGQVVLRVCYGSVHDPGLQRSSGGSGLPPLSQVRQSLVSVGVPFLRRERPAPPAAGS